MRSLTARRQLPLTLGIFVSLAASTSSAWGALASAAGGSGYSANLSSNLAIRKQQLIADPEPPDLGSTSVLYDVSKSLLAGLLDGPGYGTPSAGRRGLVLVDERGAQKMIELSLYLSTLATFGGNHEFLAEEVGWTELGYVQVNFERKGNPGRIGLTAAYQQVAYDPGTTGANGVDTFALFFDAAPTYTDGSLADYTVFAAPGDFRNFRTIEPTYAADFMQVFGANGYTVPDSKIASAHVSGPFIPEPASIGIFALAGVVLALRRPARSSHTRS